MMPTINNIPSAVIPATTIGNASLVSIDATTVAALAGAVIVALAAGLVVRLYRRVRGLRIHIRPAAVARTRGAA
jgi:hypothetical protein